MNIFFLSKNSRAAARALCDAHVVKIILEVCQMMWTAYHVAAAPQLLTVPNSLKIYKAAHIRHPTCIWVRRGAANFLWTANYGLEICHEYTRRYNKVHASEGAIRWMLANPPRTYSADEYTLSTVLSEVDIPALCSPPPLAIKDKKLIVRRGGKISLTLSYINYYIVDKKPKPWFTYKFSKNPF